MEAEHLWSFGICGLLSAQELQEGYLDESATKHFSGRHA